MDIYLSEKYKGKIVHCKRQKYDVYVGRPSIFGNPFTLKDDSNREEVIELYKRYFYQKIETNSQFKKAIDKLKGKILGCWCYPKDCHARIIIDYLEGEYNV